MDDTDIFFPNNSDRYIDRKTVETVSRELTRIIIRQIEPIFQHENQARLDIGRA